MRLSQAATALLAIVARPASASKEGARKLQECALEPIPTNPDNFGEPAAWESIVELLAFPPWETTLANHGCPAVDCLSSRPTAQLS
jgi:hypothetical protein